MLAVILATVAVSAAPRTDTIATINLNAPAYATTTSATATIWPHLGDYVTFTAAYPQNLDHYGVRIQVLCYQNGALVYGEAGPYTQKFLLGGSMSTWFLTNGNADCVADLYYWSSQGGQKFNFLAEAQFAAYAR
jgi:hypothetical protein